MKPDHERFKAKMSVLMESVRHHVKEEESELFPKVRKEIKRKELAELGEALEKAKKTAPTQPHPRAPDTPPGHLVAAPPPAPRPAPAPHPPPGPARPDPRRGGERRKKTDWEGDEAMVAAAPAPL